MIKVFYDGKCGMCSREIRHYMKISPRETFIWRDIANKPEHLKEINVSQSYALKRLHVIDEDGKIQIGVDACIAIWSKIPRWRLLAFLCAMPGIKFTLGVLYNKFADWKFARSTHCKMAVQKL